MSQMLSMMKPLPLDAEYTKEFFVKDLEYLTRTVYHILLSGLSKEILQKPNLKAP